jgi:hypothetical protein
VLVSMAQWGTRWAPCADTALELRNADTGAELAELRAYDSAGAELTPRNLRLHWRDPA